MEHHPCLHAGRCRTIPGPTLINNLTLGNIQLCLVVLKILFGCPHK